MGEGNFRIRIKKGQVELEIEGDKQFIDSRFNQLWNTLVQYPSTEEDGATTEKGEKLRSLEGLSLAEFYKSKSPRNHQETMLLFYYWLKRAEGMDEAHHSEIGKCYEQIAIPKDSAPSTTVKRLASGKKGYLMSVTKKKGYYKLTISGEAFVENELPGKKK